MIKSIEAEYIGDATFICGEEEFSSAGFNQSDEFVVIKKSEYEAIVKALTKISNFEDEPIWSDDRDVSAQQIIDIAENTLNGCYTYED